jgi:hypothetical protein
LWRAIIKKANGPLLETIKDLERKERRVNKLANTEARLKNVRYQFIMKCPECIKLQPEFKK